jgi:hypothetical protein
VNLLDDYCRSVFGFGNPLGLFTKADVATNTILIQAASTAGPGCVEAVAIPDPPPYETSRQCLVECCSRDCPKTCLEALLDALVDVLPTADGAVTLLSEWLGPQNAKLCALSGAIAVARPSFLEIRRDSRPICRVEFIAHDGVPAGPAALRPATRVMKVPLPSGFPPPASGLSYTGFGFLTALGSYVYAFSDCAVGPTITTDERCVAKFSGPGGCAPCIAVNAADPETLSVEISQFEGPYCAAGMSQALSLLGVPRVKRSAASAASTPNTPSQPAGLVTTATSTGVVSSPALPSTGIVPGACEVGSSSSLRGTSRVPSPSCTAPQIGCAVCAAELIRVVQGTGGGGRPSAAQCFTDARPSPSGWDVTQANGMQCEAAFFDRNGARVTPSSGIQSYRLCSDFPAVGTSLEPAKVIAKFADGTEAALYTSCGLRCDDCPPGDSTKECKAYKDVCGIAERPSRCWRDVLSLAPYLLTREAPRSKLALPSCIKAVRSDTRSSTASLEFVDTGKTCDLSLHFADGTLVRRDRVSSIERGPEPREHPAGAAARADSHYTGYAAKVSIRAAGSTRLDIFGVAEKALTTSQWVYVFSSCQIALEDACDEFVTDVTFPEWPTPPLPPKEACEKLVDERRDEQGSINFDDGLAKQRTDFGSAYAHECLTLTETFSYVPGSVFEHHYTLYYYDQAGNLVSAVPPAGVRPLDETEVAALAGAAPPAPRHRMVSTFRHDSRNHVLEEASPDGGVKRFFFDDAGRLRFSQTAQQRLDKTFFFTKYDARGRVVETGLYSGGDVRLLDAAKESPDETHLKRNLNDGLYPSTLAGTLSERTMNVYDRLTGPLSEQCSTLEPQYRVDERYLRGTLAAAVRENGDLGNVVSCFGYDPHGVLKTLVQVIPGLDTPKRIDYSYDLISGQVRSIDYQWMPDSTTGVRPADEFHHCYEYDDDDRLTGVYTSRDARGPCPSHEWEKDATYRYYQHGPLARLELGSNRVQGIDYAYTIQGWLKGVNRNTLDIGPKLAVARDIGKDGETLPDGSDPFARDAYGFTLGYFKDDYKAIKELACRDAAGNVTSGCWDDFEADTSGSSFIADAPDLFDGNISHSVVANRQFLADGKGVLGSAYQYDQLNRLVAARVHSSLDTTNNRWRAGVSSDGSYNELMLDGTKSGYDPNGNIRFLKRYGSSTDQPADHLMDDLEFKYEFDVNQELVANRLSWIDEKQTSSGRFPTDLDQQRPPNYAYDVDGNAISDGVEGLSTTWTAYGRPRAIKATGTSADLAFIYDSGQNRVGRRSFPKAGSGDCSGTSSCIEYWIRDHLGRTVATYISPSIGSGASTSGISLTGLTVLGFERLGGVVVSTEGVTKVYELIDYLGSVRTAVRDQTTAVDINADSIPDLNEANRAVSTDYYPSGMRSRHAGWDDYAIGFQGYEQERGLKGAH